MVDKLNSLSEAREKIAGIKKESEGVPKLKYVIRLKIGDRIFSNVDCLPYDSAKLSRFIFPK